ARDIRGLRRYAEWPKVTDAVIEAAHHYRPLPPRPPNAGESAPPAHLAGPLRDAVLAADIVFELFDHELLLGNNRLDEITNRDDADQLSAVQDRQVANPPLGDDGHAF